MTGEHPSQPLSKADADGPSVDEDVPTSRARGPRVELPPDEALEEVHGYEAAPSQPEVFQPVRAIAWAFGLGSLGAVIWAFITYVTEYELGLIAIVLGVMAGVGAARGGRTPQSQVVGAVAAFVCYVLAQLLVVFAVAFSMAMEDPSQAGGSERGARFEQPVADGPGSGAPQDELAMEEPAPAPGSLAMLLGIVLVEVVKHTFSGMGVLFLGIAVYEGYRRPRPI